MFEDALCCMNKFWIVFAVVFFKVLKIASMLKSKSLSKSGKCVVVRRCTGVPIGPGRAYFLDRPDPGRAESGLVFLQARSGSGQVGPTKKAGPIGPGFGPSLVSAEKISKFEFFCREKK